MVSKREQDEDETQYVYNKMGKMVKLISPSGKTTKYYYRHDGLRNRKIESDGDEILYYWGAGGIPPLLSERKQKNGSSAVSPLVSYPPGMNGMRLFFGKQGRNFYYLTDHLGSVYYIVDEKATIINSYDYDEFGVVTTKNEHLYLGSKLYNTKGFTGEPQHQEEDGMVYLRQRYYVPILGVFISSDPASLSLNPYPYCSSDPVNWIDPSGLKQMEPVKATTPGGGTVRWYESYPLPQLFNLGGDKQKVREAADKFLGDYYDTYKRSAKYPGWEMSGYVLCTDWVNEFVTNKGSSESAGESLTELTITMQTTMNNKLKKYNINIINIIPYSVRNYQWGPDQNNDNHDFTILRINYQLLNSTKKGTLWILTETNYPDLKGGTEEYRSYPVRPPYSK